MAEIRITVDGRRALTVGQIAVETGWLPSSVRATLYRAGLEPAAYLDGRTPLYRATAVRRLFHAP